MRIYQLLPVGVLYFTKAAVKGPKGISVLRLLVDTGSTYTILPVEVLETLGCNPTGSKKHIRITTGSGSILAPQVTVAWFQALGEKVESFKVVGHTLPAVGPIDGLLGMDFLRRVKAKLNLASGLAEIP